MREILAMALRNLTRRKGRTALTLAMMLLGTLLTVFSAGMAEGSYSQILEASTGSMTGQVQIAREGYVDKPSLFHTVQDAAAAEARLAATPDVRATTRRVEAAGLVSADLRTTGAMVVGVDPVDEPRVTTLNKAVAQGAWLDEAPPDVQPIILGVALAQRLKVELGGEVSFYGQAADGGSAQGLFTVVGLLKTGTDEADGGLALVRLSDAQEMLALDGRVHRILGSVPLRRVDRVVGTAGVAGGGNVLHGWQTLIPGLEGSIAADRAGYQIFLTIVLLVVLLGVTNTMMMAVLERTREYGVMIALGTTPGRLLALTLAEGFWVSAIGTVAGALLGAGLNWWTGRIGIPVGMEGFEFGGVAFDRMFPANDVVSSLVYPALILACGVLAALIPAVRASRLSPVEALRR